MRGPALARARASARAERYSAEPDAKHRRADEASHERKGWRSALVTTRARGRALGRGPTTPEVGGPGRPSQNPERILAMTFVAYDVALQLIRELRSIVESLREQNRDLADQITRAGSSVLLNLGEGNRRRGGDRRRFFDYAHGSASEVRTALDTADAWGWVVEASAARATLDRLLGLLWGLTHAPRARAGEAPK
jgi:four helix bundle protein